MFKGCEMKFYKRNTCRLESGMRFSRKQLVASIIKRIDKLDRMANRMIKERK